MEQVTPSSAPVADSPVAVLTAGDTPDATIPPTTRAEARSSRRAAEPVRGDIQGLRAVAVLIVLVFHFWPEALTGGYVGVDVFFVISGFLISSHLMRSPPTTRACSAGSGPAGCDGCCPRRRSCSASPSWRRSSGCRPR